MSALVAFGLLDNPFDNELFVPTVVRIALLLGLGALMVLVVERRRLARLRQSSLYQKVLSWSIMAPTFLAAIFIGGPVGGIVVGFLIVQGLSEYNHLVGIDRSYARLVIAAGLATMVLTGVLTRFFLFAPLGFFMVVTMLPILTGRIENAHRQVTMTLFGYIYIPFFLCYLVFIRAVEPAGVEILIVVGLAVALSDILAFVSGSLIGGPKLAPRVSPNKTWAGATGNVVGAYAGWLVMWFALPGTWTTATRLLAPLMIGVAALYGDLVQSLIKRDFGVKDAGDLLPGFGGLLDRIDSLLVALPVGYYTIIVTQYFTHQP